MLALLAKFVEKLPNETFFLQENYFEKIGHSPEKVSILKQKGHYPYSYFNSFKKIPRNLPPTRAIWRSSLTGGDLSVSRSEYDHSLKVFTELKCGSPGDYHDLYLTTDVLLLASVFEAFREVCYQIYGLDCSCYFTASNISGDRPEILNGSWTSGLFAANYTRRHLVGLHAPVLQCKQKIPRIFLPSEPSSYILNIDANILYGGYWNTALCHWTIFQKLKKDRKTYCSILHIPGKPQSGVIWLKSIWPYPKGFMTSSLINLLPPLVK